MNSDGLTCEQVLEQLLAYLDLELDAETTAHIERHLEACRGCYSRAEFEKQLKARLQESRTSPAPDRLRARIKRMLDDF